MSIIYWIQFLSSTRTLAILGFVFLTSSAQIVHVSRTCSQKNSTTCKDLDTALDVAQPDTVLQLENGTHALRKLVLVNSVRNITIESFGKANIVCQNSNAALGFYNSSWLTISNVIISNCGMTMANLELVISMAFNDTAAFVNVPAASQVALVIARSERVTLQGVVIRNTSGLGLLGLNLLGESQVSDCHFVENRSPACPWSLNYEPKNLSGKLVGGGAYFYYYDFAMDYNKAVVLNIENSLFYRNQGCNDNGIMALNIKYSGTLQSIGYQVGEGALAIVMSQLQFHVTVGLNRLKFEQNVGRTGSGIQVIMFTGTNNVHVFVDSSNFTSNGLPMDKPDDLQYQSVGGGVAVLLDVVRPNELKASQIVPSIIDRNVTINICNSVFVENSAYMGGGVYVYSMYISPLALKEDDIISMLVNNCSFERNHGVIAGAIYAYETKVTSLDLGFLLTIRDTTITDCLTGIGKDLSFMSLSVGSCAVELYALNVTFDGTVVIEETKGSGMHAHASTMWVVGNLSLLENNGLYGGGLALFERSQVVMAEESSLIIKKNVGNVAGGGLYFDSTTSVESYAVEDCYLYFNVLDRLNKKPISPSYNVSLQVMENMSPIGSTVYGSTLETCAWAMELRTQSPQKADDTIYNLLNDMFGSTFHFDSGSRGSMRSLLSTPSNNLVLKNKSSSYVVMPGQELTLELVAEDRFLNPIPVPITSLTNDVMSPETGGGMMMENLQASVLVGDSGYWFLDGALLQYVPLTVSGTQGETLSVQIYTTDSFAVVDVMVRLSECVAGFAFNSSTSSCECLSVLKESGVTCDIDQQSFTVPEGLWVGPITTNANGSYSMGDLVISQCILDYCETGTATVVSGSFDVQCSEENRTGLLCGSCAEGFSASLGSSRCLQCSNWWLFLIPTFFLIIFLITLITFFFEISLTEGFLNGFIFYANIAFVYRNSIIDFADARPIFIPLQIANLHFSFDVCLYNGMDELFKTGLQFVFPFFMFVITTMFYVLAKYSKFLVKRGPSAVKTFATVMLISYVNILLTCSQILAFVSVETTSGEQHIRWRYDPTVPYFVSPWHGILVVISSLLLIFYIIPLPIVLLFPTKLYKNRKLNYFKPLYDAFWHPFVPKFRFWLGLRLLLRFFPFFFETFVGYPTNIFLVILFLLTLAMVQVQLQPFKGKWQNLLDVVYLYYLIVLFTGVLFFSTKSSDDSHSTANVTFSSIMIALALLTFILIFIYHVDIRFPKMRLWLQHCWGNCRSCGKDKDSEDTKEEVELQELKTATSTTLSIPEMKLEGGGPLHSNESSQPHVVSFTQFREPLLDDGEVEIESHGIMIWNRSPASEMPHHGPNSNLNLEQKNKDKGFKIASLFGLHSRHGTSLESESTT